jgi:endoglucanase
MKSQPGGLLKRLTEAHGVPGYEDEVREIFCAELAGAGKFATDRAGSVLCDLGGKGPRVLLAGHMDEVGFRVQNITEDGFLKLVAVGGWWPHVLLAQTLVVKTTEGRKISGVVGSKPPHFMPEAERKNVMPLDQMFVDVGASSRDEVAEWGVRVGDPVAPDTRFQELAGKGRYLAKAFDNRAGMGVAIEAGKELAAMQRSNCLLVAGTVQEEVGLRGAQTLATLAKPDVAVLLEGTPADDTPGFDPSMGQGRVGEGVQIRMHDPSAIMNPRLAALAVETAEKEGIPHQVAVRTSGGTDAGRVHLTGEGVPCVVLGVPARYIHSHRAVIDMVDYVATTRLAVALVKRLTPARVKKLSAYL